MYALAAVAPAPHCNSTQGVEPCASPFSIPVIEGACMCSPRWRRREHVSLPCGLPRKTGKNENTLLWVFIFISVKQSEQASIYF